MIFKQPGILGLKEFIKKGRSGKHSQPTFQIAISFFLIPFSFFLFPNLFVHDFGLHPDRIFVDVLEQQLN